MNEKVTIIGGGHQGLAMAAHLTKFGVKCYLWNRTTEHIKDIMETGEILCRGIYDETIKIQCASGNIQDVLQKTIMVTTPSTAHKDVAKMLAGYVDDSYCIILNPGRTFGAVEFVKTLQENGCKKLPIVAETQTIAYTCRREKNNIVYIYALKKGIPVATYQSADVHRVFDYIPECLTDAFVPVESYYQTSLSNIGMILHCAPVLMNIGWIENDKVDFKYYYEGISPSVAGFLEKMDTERMEVVRQLGITVLSVQEWLQHTYSTKGDNLYENLRSNLYYKDIDAPLSIHHRYIEEDVPNGLVPMEALGRKIGVPTPNISLIIDLANAIMNTDYRKNGRSLNDLFEKEDKKW